MIYPGLDHTSIRHYNHNKRFQKFLFFLTNFAFKILHGCNITFYFRIHSHLELKYEKKLEFQKTLVIRLKTTIPYKRQNRRKTVFQYITLNLPIAIICVAFETILDISKLKELKALPP